MFPSFPPGISGDEFNLLFYGYQSQEEIRALLQNLSLAVSNTALELPSGRKRPFAFPAEFPGIRKTVQICLR